MKIGIIVDSSCGLTQKEASKRNWYYLPLIMSINDHDYYEGRDIDAQNFSNIVKIEDKVKTSLTPLAIMEETIKDASSANDHVIIYSLSNQLSSQCNTLQMVAKNFNNVHVIKSTGIGMAITRDIENIEKIISKNNLDIASIVQKLEMLSNSQYGFLVPRTLEWLVKGGRISPALASMAGLLKIVPIISFKNGKLDKHDKGRVFEKTAFLAAKSLIEEKKETSDFIIYDGGYDNVDKLRTDLLKLFPSINLSVVSLPPAVILHTGPGSVGIMSIAKIDD